MSRFGISAALLTPFDEDGRLDAAKLARHAADLLARGLDGVTPFGTTGEGASIGRTEREAGLAALLDAGIDPGRIVVGLCGTALADVAEQARQGGEAGIRRFLVPPPFYFRDASEEGLAAWHAALLAHLSDDAALILYHIPQVTGVPLPVGLVRDLATRFPGRIAAIKDSSGDLANATALIRGAGVPVLVGDERRLHEAAAMGAAGSICGMANLYPERMARIFADKAEDAALSAEVTAIVSQPVIPAMKARLAALTGEPGWARVRAPLMPLPAEAVSGAEPTHA